MTFLRLNNKEFPIDRQVVQVYCAGMSAGTAEVTKKLVESLGRPFGTSIVEATGENRPENVLTAHYVELRFNEMIDLDALHKYTHLNLTEFNGKQYRGTSTVVDFNGIPLAARTYWNSDDRETGFVPTVYCGIHGNDNGQPISYGFREFEEKSTGENLVVYHYRVGNSPTFQFYGDKSWLNSEMQIRIGKVLGIFKK